MGWLKESRKILGLNARNLLFTRNVNTKEAVQAARNKLLTKRTLEEASLPVPKTYTQIQNRRELLAFDWEKLPESFVIKPNLGSGGGGILIIFKQKKGTWITLENKTIPQKDLMNHISNILDGNYSFGNTPDIAFFEERLRVTPELKPWTYKGVPDIRVIAYQRIPVMAMMRLPTRASEGKANLHRGAVCVGIDIARGITTHAILWDREIAYHPDTKLLLAGIKIPFWMEILRLSIRAQEATHLGYLGADIAIDARYGPMILEVNAHPGLSIQLANRTPLKERLLRVDGVQFSSIEKNIRLAQDLFGGEYEQEIEETTGRTIVGLVENIELLTPKQEWKKVQAKIDTGADLTSVDIDLIQELGFKDSIATMKKYRLPAEIPLEEADENIKEKYRAAGDIVVVQSSHGKTIRLKIPLTIRLAEHVLEVKATVVSRGHLRYPIIIGRKDLKKFLVDPQKPML